MELGIGNNMINSIMMLKDISTTGNAAETATRKAAGSRNEKELKDACMGFEKIFLQMMYKYMKKMVPDSGLISKGLAEDIFESMLDEKLMEEASRSGSFGLADMIYRQLKDSY